MKNLQEFDYLKELENNVETFISADQYMIARLDGNNFHNFTKGLKRPFDAVLRETMATVTKKLVEQFGATEAFTQSDEITLIWAPRMNRTNTGLVDHPRSGRVLKLSTLMSSYATLEFYKLIHNYKSTNYNGFDCRLYGGDEKAAIDSKRFRFIDAATNAYQLVAQSLWSQKQLNGVSIQDIKAMLVAYDINVWQAYGEEAMLGVHFYKELNEETGRNKIVRTDGGEMMKKLKSSIDI